MNPTKYLEKKGIEDVVLSSESGGGVRYFKLSELIGEYGERLMAGQTRRRYKNKTGYKGVYFHKSSNKYRATANIDGFIWHSTSFKTAREAAIAYDKKMIEIGELPVNILTKEGSL